MSLPGIQNLVVQGGSTVNLNIVGGDQINTSESSIGRRFATSVSWPVFLPQALLSHAEEWGMHIHRSVVARCFALSSAIPYRWWCPRNLCRHIRRTS